MCIYIHISAEQYFRYLLGKHFVLTLNKYIYRIVEVEPHIRKYVIHVTNIKFDIKFKLIIVLYFLSTVRITKNNISCKLNTNKYH